MPRVSRRNLSRLSNSFLHSLFSQFYSRLRTMGNVRSHQALPMGSCIISLCYGGQFIPRLRDGVIAPAEMKVMEIRKKGG
jgi:hypothetical protein